MNSTPRSNRTHIAVLGRRNVGKSAFMNAFLGQEMSIVSDTPGTTTDPVEKSYELQPFGPVVLIDTAGVDDQGELGEKRVEKTRKVLARADLAVLICEVGVFSRFEAALVDDLQGARVPFLLLAGKADLADAASLDAFTTDLAGRFEQTPVLRFSVTRPDDVERVKDALSKLAAGRDEDLPIISDLVQSPSTVVLVVPIDKEAPRGRLILPQVQTLRELLDADIATMVVKERELEYTLRHVLRNPPALVVTDSQAFLKVDADVPPEVPLTSFSILFARHKGDLAEAVRGVRAISRLKDGSRVLIAEACSHRPISEDIGRVKLPRWLGSVTGARLEFDVRAGHDFPEDLTGYDLIIQCGGCMVNRAAILTRIRRAVAQGVPVTNYGVAIAYLHGILPRAILMFPEAMAAWEA
ncbi:MAG: [FeFe] hydrogenase H-cluster maturation GTPase HydF [Deltaproteobacteria bacterium HGW-Deltaproteobacteria-22]|nr:MAG: [FeFe] hydrogenase H-cluster maturation GTPase HydF [Deltaproteobacteria bacterium HGW-Deltaproteobacteria-22]